VQVHAGLAPIDRRILELPQFHASRIAMYFQTFTPVLLSYERYTVPMAAPDCDSSDASTSSCNPFFLPGGLETARAVNGSLLNSTLLEGSLFQAHHETIKVDNAPGFLLAYKPLPPDVDFDRDDECTVYGHGGDDALQICIRSVSPSLEVGK
jgi:hypothetical protein